MLRGSAGWSLVALGAGIVGVVAEGLRAAGPGVYGDLEHDPAVHYITCALAAGVLYGAAVWLVRRRAVPAWSVWAILGLGLVARLLVVTSPPLMSTDLYRYVWDGRVQAAGINPYRYIPADPALAFLRDAHTGATSIFGNINRPETAPTIYPPAAQGLFAIVGVTASSIWTIKAAMLAFDLLTTAVALLLLGMAGLPAARIVVWAWNPLVIWEFSGAGHIDAAAVALSAVAVLAAARLRPGWAGAALGVAVLFKFLPAALFPALWRPWTWRTPVAAGAVILAGYAAYASVGLGVFGYLAGYAEEEGLDGGGFLLLRLFGLVGPLPGWAGKAYMAGGLAVLGAAAAWVAFRRGRSANADVIARDALILGGALIAVLSPHYPWYLTMLVMPAVLVPAWSALWPAFAGPLLYLDHGHDDVVWPAIVFLPVLPLLAAELFFRRRGGS